MVVVALPLVFPAIAAALCLLSWRVVLLQRVIAFAGTLATVVAAIALLVAAWHGEVPELRVGGWPAGMAIRLRGDLLSAVLVLAVSILALAVISTTSAVLPHRDVAFGGPPVLLLLVTGVCGVFLTADLFDLYVWLEVVLIASFVLLTFGGTREQLRGGTVYVVLSVIASALLLVGIAFVYSAVHALDLEVVRPRLAALAIERPQLVRMIAAILLVGFGIKAAVFPLFFWLPVAYPSPAPAISALFACLAPLGAYAMARIVLGGFPVDPVIQHALVIAAVATIVAGTAAAITQVRLRALVSFLDIGHIGYVVAALAVAMTGALSVPALGGAIYYLVHHIVVTANLMLIAGVVHHLRGHEELTGLGGLARKSPVLAVAFVLTGLSIAGIPPMSGFWAKVAVLRPAIAGGYWAFVGAAVLGGLLTLIAFARVWNDAFAGIAQSPQPAEPLGRARRVLVYGPVLLLTAVTVLLGAFPGPPLAVARAAAAALVGGAP